MKRLTNFSKLISFGYTRGLVRLLISSLLLSLIAVQSCTDLERSNPVDPGTTVDPESWAPKDFTIWTAYKFDIMMSWDYTSDVNIDGFIISRWKQGEEDEKQIIATPGKDDRAFLDSTVEIFNQYNYEIVSKIGEVTSSIVRRDHMLDYYVASPSQLSLQRETPVSVRLEWNDQSDDEEFFIIETNRDSTVWTIIDSVVADQTTYLDTGLTVNLNYDYRVYAKNQFAESGKTNVASIFMDYDLGIIHEFWLTRPDSDYTSIDVRWIDGCEGERGFVVEMKTGETEWLILDTTDADVEHLLVEDLTILDTYTFRVKAFSEFGETAYSSERSMTLSFDFPAPSGLTAEEFQPYDVQLNWSDNTDNEAGFRIERSHNDGGWAELITLDPDITSYQDVDLTVGGVFSYRIKAIHNLLDSEWSDTTEVEILPEYGTVTDYDGNQYTTKRFGDQLWMIENLRVTHYRNGDLIPHMSETSEWLGTFNGARCYYNSDSSQAAFYGALYNWYTVDDARGMAPQGWHVATDDDWKVLERFLGMDSLESEAEGYRGTTQGAQLAGNSDTWGNGALKNSADFESSGFNAIAAGNRVYNSAQYQGLYWNARFWTSTRKSPYTHYGPWFRDIDSGETGIRRDENLALRNGFSVRCVKD